MTAESHRLDSVTIPELSATDEHVDEQTQTHSSDLASADQPKTSQFRYSYKLSASPSDDPVPLVAESVPSAEQETSAEATRIMESTLEPGPIFARPTNAGGAALDGTARIAAARGCGSGGDRIQFAFTAPSAQAVKVWYDRALALGARDNGKPGPRPHHHPGYFAAYVIDPDGWHLEAVTQNYRAPRPSDAWFCSWLPFRR